MILQACISEPSIRHAAVAIGALGKTYETAQAGLFAVTGYSYPSTLSRLPAPKTNPEPRSAADVAASVTLVSEAYGHHRLALEQYDKAFKRMQVDSHSLRTRLLVCIIVICFEALHGNHEGAAAQLQKGLALVQDWSSRQPQKSAQGFSSPVPDDVEDYLVQTFGRMEIQSMSVFDPRPVSVHEHLKKDGKEEIQHMPSSFSSIDHARVYLDLITRRLMHFNRSIHPREEGGCAPPEDTPAPWADGTVVQPIPWIDDRETTADKIEDEQNNLILELTTWDQSFAPLLASSVALGGQDAISALAMSISVITSQISLRAAFFTIETAYDIFLPEFKSIVSHSALLLKFQDQHHQKSNNSSTTATPEPNTSSPEVNSSSNLEKSALSLPLRFSFDLAVVPPLYTTVIKCRDPQIRRSALKLLDRYPRREGVWDSMATAGLGRWVMALEEEGASRYSSAGASPESSAGGGENGTPVSESSGTLSGSGNGSGKEKKEVYPIIPEEMRVRKASMRFNLLERRANMTCMQMDFETGVFVDKREVLRW